MVSFVVFCIVFFKYSLYHPREKSGRGFSPFYLRGIKASAEREGAKSRDYKEVELPQFSVPTFSKFLVYMLGKGFETRTPLAEHSKW